MFSEERIRLSPAIVYNFYVGNSNTTYHGKTKRYFKINMCEHVRVSTLTEIRVTGVEDSAIKKYFLLNFV